MNRSPVTAAVADGSLVLSLPEGFEFWTQEDGTICATPQDAPDEVVLRISSITVGMASPAAEVDFAAKVAAEGRARGAEVSQVEEWAWYHEDLEHPPEEESAEPLWLRFWWVGYRNSKVIVSLTCDSSDRHGPLVLQALEQVSEMLRGAKVRGEKSSLTSQDEDLLDEQREWIMELLASRYDTFALPQVKADLPVLQQIVDERVFEPGEEYAWSSLGVVFGDILARELDLHWVIHRDAEGVEPALRLGETSVTLFPRTMLLKRTEQGERPVLAELLEGLADTIGRLQHELG